MKVQKINNTSEYITYTELSKGLEGSGLLIFPKLLLKDVIAKEVRDSLTKSLKNTIEKSHFDFVVTDDKHMPLFAVEFDGPHHKIYDKKIKSDIRKNRICQIANLPLIRVSDAHLIQHDYVSIVQFIVYRFKMWRENSHIILKEIANKIDEMTDAESQRFNEDNLSVDHDPSFQFHLMYPFPKSQQIETQLDKEFGLKPFPPNKGGIHAFWYAISPGGRGTLPSGKDYLQYSYGIYWGKYKNRLSWNNGKLQDPDTQILCEDRMQIDFEWPLVTAEDYDLAEPPYLYFDRNGHMPVYFGDIPGAQLPYIIDAICEFFCYKRVLEWAEQNIKNRHK